MALAVTCAHDRDAVVVIDEDHRSDRHCDGRRSSSTDSNLSIIARSGFGISGEEPRHHCRAVGERRRYEQLGPRLRVGGL